MDAKEVRKREMEALIAAIWGSSAADRPAPADPQMRASQNAALAAALRAYLQQYLAEM